ncbi:MAG: hypothetical protein WC381_08405 [Kiritimatiellia bacterium]
MPFTGGERAADLATAPEPATAAVAGQEVEREFPEISDVLADAHEQINALTQANDELQFRRRFLEKRHAITSQSLQALWQEVAAIRKALDRTEAILKTMEDPSFSDTQPMA